MSFAVRCCMSAAEGAECDSRFAQQKLMGCLPYHWAEHTAEYAVASFDVKNYSGAKICWLRMPVTDASTPPLHCPLIRHARDASDGTTRLEQVTLRGWSRSYKVRAREDEGQVEAAPAPCACERFMLL